MIQEKRRFTRIPFKVKTEMRVGKILYTTEVIDNLSIGGCRLPVNAIFDLGMACQIRILLTGSSTDLDVRIDGEIIRCDGNTVAVKFKHIDPDSLFHLKNVIRYNSVDPDVVEDEIFKYPMPR